MMAVLFLLSAFLIIQPRLAAEILDSDSAVANLLSVFESQLQDAIFQALESHERPRRAAQVPDAWTGFVPNLYQQREQLVIDSLEISSSSVLCPNGSIDGGHVFDVMRYRQQDYLLVACDNHLILYRISLTSLTPLYEKILDGNGLALKHFSLTDPESGDAILFVIILMPTSLEVYKLGKDGIEFSNGLQLIQQFRDVQVFNFRSAVYFVLLDPATSDQMSPGIYKLDVDNGRVSIHLVTSVPFIEDSLIQICNVDGKTHLFHSNGNRDRLDMYIIHSQEIELYQTFDADGIQDFKCFSIGATHYLAFSTFSSMKILEFVHGFYENLQSLPLTGVSAILPLSPPTYRDDTLLMVGGFDPVTKKDFVDLLVFDATSFTFRTLNSSCSRPVDWNRFPSILKASDIGCLAGIENLDIGSIASIVSDGKLLFIIPLQSQSLLVVLNVHLEPVANPVLAQFSHLHDQVEATATAAQGFRDRSHEFYEFSKGIVLYDSDVKLEGSWDINTIQVPEVTLGDLSQKKVEFNPELWIPGLDVIVDDIERRMFELEQMIDGIDRYLQGTIQNGTEESISLERLSVDGSILVKQLEVTKLSVDQLNELDFGPLMNDIVRRDSNRMIESLSIMGSLTVDTLSSEQVNNIWVKDIVLKSEPNISINGNVTIHNQLNVTGYVIINGTVNNLNPNQIATPADHLGTIIFTEHTHVDQMSIEGYLNGINASQVFSSIIVNQSIDTQLDRGYFDNLVIEGDLKIDSGLVNEVDIVSLNSTALRLDRDQLIEGTMIFAGGVEIKKYLKVGSVNGVQFEEFLVRGSNLDEVVMTGMTDFRGTVTSRQVNVDQKVNGHLLQNALTYDTNQNVTSPVKFLNGFEIPNGDLKIDTLNQVNWNLMQQIGVHPALLKQHGFKKNVTIRNLCSIGGSLNAEQLKVNGENLEDILSDLVYADGDEIIISGIKRFSSLKVNGLQVDGYINGMKILKEILVSSTDQTITGDYNFQSYVDFSSLNVKGHLNEYNLTELLDSVLQFDGDLESVTCRLKFNHISVSDQVLVNGSINGFPTDLMLLNGVDQSFTAPQKLVFPDFSSLKIGGSLNITDHTSLVNGLDLDLFDRRRVTLSTDQWIRGTWNLRNLTADSISFRALNGLSLNEWNASFIYSQSPVAQSIQAQGFNFDTLEIRGDVTTSLQEINGFNLKNLDEVAGDIRQDLVFNGNSIFTHLECQEIVVNGTINNYSVQQLAKDAVYRNQSPLITGLKTFQNLRVNGNVEADLINGRTLIESYLHFSADQHIEAPIKFENQVVVRDLTLVGGSATLNGVPNDILFSSHTLTHNINKGDVVFENPIEVSSLDISSLHGEDWDLLVSSLAHLNETNQFNGDITFTNPVEIKGTLHVDKLNGVDLNNFTQDLVLKDVTADIIARKVIKNLETPLLTTYRIQSESVYPDIVGTAEQAIRLDNNDTVNRTLQFEAITVGQNVQSATLNSLPFPGGFVTVDSEQDLPSFLEVESIEMLGDIILKDEARVNGFDLVAEYNNTWMTDTSSKIHSTKVFHGQIQILGNLTVNRKVNEVTDFGREIVPLSAGGSIYGAPRLTDLTVSGNITNVELTNDINLADLAAKAIYLDSQIDTDGTWTMSKASIHGGSFLLPIETKINQQVLYVGQLAGSINSTNDVRLIELEEKTNFDIANRWFDALRYSYYKLDHLDLDQVITLPHQVTSLSDLLVNGTSFLFIGTRGGSMVYRRNATKPRYTLAGILPETTNVSKWLPLAPHMVSLSSTSAEVWRISEEPFRMQRVKVNASNVVDIVNEPLHRLRLAYNGNVSLSNPVVASLSGIKVYERAKTPAELSNTPSSLNSDVKMHSFRLGSRSMIAVIPTFSTERSAGIVGCQGVRIFSTSTISIKLEHVIPACDVRAITSFSHGNMPDDYLVLAEHESVVVYHYEGASGFIKAFGMPYPSACALHSWSIRSGNGRDLLVAVATGNHVSIQRSVTVGDYIGND